MVRASHSQSQEPLVKFLRSPLLAGAIAATLASTTGYCVLQRGDPDEPPPAPVWSPPVRLLPEAVIPYPIPPAE